MFVILNLKSIMIVDKFFASRSKFIILLAILSLLQFSFHEALGHGIGAETLPPVMIGNKNVTLAINEFTAPNDPNGQDKAITIQLYDSNTKLPVRDVTYYLEAINDDKILFKRTFERDNGFLSMIVHTTESDKVSFEEGSFLVNLFKSIIGEKSGTMKINGPIFDSGGLYKFHIELLTIDSYENKLSKPVAYDPSISIPQTTSYQIYDKEYGNQELKITTYYDLINNFQYIPDDRLVKFEMPFDWSEEIINQISVVHQEVHIPKSFGNLLVTKYMASINGLELPRRAVTIDDYSTDDRIVHIVINRPSLLEMAKRNHNPTHDMLFELRPSNKPSFPVVADAGRYEVNLSWDPPNIVAGNNTRFLYKIYDLYVSDSMPTKATFDFSIVQKDKVIFNQSSTSGFNYTNNIIDVPMPLDVTGPIKIKFENLESSNRTAEFIAVINKEQQGRYALPIKLPSFVGQGNNRLPGEYEVDLAWSPQNISIDNKTEFIFEIKNKSSDKTVPQSKYDFILLQNGNELYRKSGVAQAGNDVVNYLFSSDQDGPAVLRIENINNSGESVEVTLVVTPEFPAVLIPIMFVGILFVIIISKNSKFCMI